VLGFKRVSPLDVVGMVFLLSEQSIRETRGR
jgi:hypothetical protein